MTRLRASDRVAEELCPDEAGYYLGANRDVARALGIPVHRSDALERGQFVMMRDQRGDATGIFVGTRLVDPLEAVRRDVRRWVRDDARRAGIVTPELGWKWSEQHKAEELIDQLVGTPPAWPA